jgi:hypothetical protein
VEEQILDLHPGWLSLAVTCDLLIWLRLRPSGGGSRSQRSEIFQPLLLRGLFSRGCSSAKCSPSGREKRRGRVA